MKKFITPLRLIVFYFQVYLFVKFFPRILMSKQMTNYDNWYQSIQTSLEMKAFVGLPLGLLFAITGLAAMLGYIFLPQWSITKLEDLCQDDWR